MLQYILRRILLALPTLLIISFLAFGLGKCAPGDPVVNVFGDQSLQTLDPTKQAENYRANAARLGLDGPLFYISFTSAAYPDTLWRIYPPDRRDRLKKWVGQTGNWQATSELDQAIIETVRQVEPLPDVWFKNPAIRVELATLVRATTFPDLDTSAVRLSRHFSAVANDSLRQPAGLMAALNQLNLAVQQLHTQQTPGKLTTPALYWNGLNNQYHHWLSGFVTGNLGLTRKKVSVWQDVQAAMMATLTINGLAILLTYLIAIPFGVEMARRRGGWLDRWGKRLLFFVYSMPVFWLGALLVLLIMSTEWGRSNMPSLYFDIQDSWVPGKTNFGDWWSANSSKCVLPILILVLHMLGILAIQMRAGMLSALEMDFIRTARAKGVGEEEVYWKHAFRNALFPIITVFASVLPALFTGSLVVEAMFGFPGMGSKTFEAYLNSDLPLLSVIIMVAAVLTILGSLIADLLYAWADPRVRFTKKT
ncbi:MAG: ABC transporter permease [Saprospiraceae bacterium]|nr:ABC transporter permease [Saprospiraceae bacterium]